MKKFLTLSIVALLSLGIGLKTAFWYQNKQDMNLFLPLVHFQNKLSESIAQLQHLRPDEQEKELKELAPLIQAAAKKGYIIHQKSRAAVLFLMFQSPAAFVSQESLRTTYDLFYEAGQKFYNNL